MVTVGINTYSVLSTFAFCRLCTVESRTVCLNTTAHKHRSVYCVASFDYGGVVVLGDAGVWREFKRKGNDCGVGATRFKRVS